MNLFRHRRFYRGGLQISGLQTLWSRIPISISCNVALGEPNLNAVFPTQPLEDTPFPARRQGCSHQSEFTRPYPNFPIHGPKGTPSFPPVLFRCSAAYFPTLCTVSFSFSRQ